MSQVPRRGTLHRQCAFVYRPPVLTPRWSCHLLGVAAFGAVCLGTILLGTGLLATSTAHAHFILTSPPAAREQNFLGDPQKAPPCGDAGNAVATGVLTDYKGGDVVTITIDETIFHPGHYRIAIATNDISELPAEPPVTPNNTDCGTVPIQAPPVFPVLADGVFPHDKPFDQPQSIDITLPADLNCDNCTLQVIQFMSNHGLNNPGGCFYHHCATISVQGAASGTTTGTSDSGDEGTAGTGATSVTTTTTGTETSAATGTATTTAGSQGDTAGNEPTAGDTGATTGAATSGPANTSGGEASTDGAGNDTDSGCGCSGTGGGQGPATLAALGLLGLLTRRKRD